MKTCVIKVYNESKYPLPEYKTSGSAGMDVRANITEPLFMLPKKVYTIPTGLYIELPYGIEAQIRARSGLAVNHGISLVNGIGTIDSDYRGEIKIPMINLLDKPYHLQAGERVAQIVYATYLKGEFFVVDNKEEMTETLRGSGGFGHTGQS
ncbi:dUTP diphosphatase [Eubacteriaceae bacterium ES3]|nr:dUTP diphosphatase [Eubacteriaceae bacterium ES3]